MRGRSGRAGRHARYIRIPWTETKGDAEQDQAVRICFDEFLAAPAGLFEDGQRLDDMIRRQEQHQRLRIFPEKMSGGEGHAGSCVAGAGLDEDVGRGEVRQLSPGLVRLGGVGDHPLPFGRDPPRATIGSRLDQRTAAAEREKLFGKCMATGGPEARAGPTGHDDSVKHGTAVQSVERKRPDFMVEVGSTFEKRILRSLSGWHPTTSGRPEVLRLWPGRRLRRGRSIHGGSPGWQSSPQHRPARRQRPGRLLPCR